MTRGLRLRNQAGLKLASRRSVRRFTLPELLEARTMLSAYLVSSSGDDGSAGTLRDAIAQVNAGLYNEIDFAGPMTIAVSSALPAITQGALINGPTDASGHPLVELNGSGAGAGVNGLEADAAGVTIQGLAIDGFGGAGILLASGGSDTVQGNFLGIDPGGTFAIANGTGLVVSSSGNLIGGTAVANRNVISGNLGDGVDLTGDSNTIQNNYIGTGAAGAIAVGNGGSGVVVDHASNTLIGGSTATARNVISGNNREGVLFTNDSLAGNVLEGNYIGLDAGGSLPLGNQDSGVNLGTFNALSVSNLQVLGNTISANAAEGIYVYGSFNNLIQGNLIGTDAAGDAALDQFGNSTLGNGGEGIGFFSNSYGNVVGGAMASAANIISGNNGDGIGVSTLSGTSNTIQGNLIGVDILHLADGNGSQGIYVSAGQAVVSGNVISANFGYGMLLQAGGATVTGNFIGTDASGANLGNAQDGVYITSSNNTIGGTDPGQGNVIAFNGQGGTGAGVFVFTGTSNAIRGNSIFSNATLGIALGSETGVLLNDSAGHTGPNNYQDFPVISSAAGTAASLTITGTLDALPNTTYALDFCSNTVGDASGYGQGQTYVGSDASVTTDASGHASFSVTFSNVPVGQNVISATATDSNGNTSEFGADVTAVISTPTMAGTTTTVSSNANPSKFGQPVTFTATVTGGTQSPTGTVTFFAGTTQLAVVTLAQGSNVAMYSTASLAVGGATITAVYSGDGSYNGSQGSLSQSVSRADTTTSLTASATSLTAGQSVTFTATVTPAAGQYPAGVVPTGSVMFMDGNTQIGTGTLDSTGTATFATTSFGLGTHQITAVYNSDANFAASQSSAVNLTVQAAAGSISGHTYFDMTGNGLSSDDRIMGGITVKLFVDRNGNNTLDSADGAAIMSTVSDSTTGAFSFVNLQPGTYFVEEVTPAGYVRTAPTTSAYYVNAMTTGSVVSNDDFDNYQTDNCANEVSGVKFIINGRTCVTDLRGHVHQGDTVQVQFNVTQGHTDLFSLVSYIAPAASFSASTASQQSIFQDASGVFGPGLHSLTVVVPQCYFQIDFVCGAAIDKFGPKGSNIFYSAEGRLLSADNGGTCSYHG